jgi:hypothetical protein
MAKRPAGMSVEEWRKQRAAYWKRVNWTLNVLMLVAIAALLWRYTRG